MSTKEGVMRRPLSGVVLAVVAAFAVAGRSARCPHQERLYAARRRKLREV
jgi:hypothetical protein